MPARESALVAALASLVTVRDSQRAPGRKAVFLDGVEMFGDYPDEQNAMPQALDERARLAAAVRLVAAWRGPGLVEERQHAGDGTFTDEDVTKCVDAAFRVTTGAPSCEELDAALAKAAEIRARKSPAAPPVPPQLETRPIAEALVRALHLYPHYRVDSRGPSGCILDALDVAAPTVAAELREYGADDVYRRHFADRGALPADPGPPQPHDGERATCVCCHAPQATEEEHSAPLLGGNVRHDVCYRRFGGLCAGEIERIVDAPPPETRPDPETHAPERADVAEVLSLMIVGSPVTHAAYDRTAGKVHALAAEADRLRAEATRLHGERDEARADLARRDAVLVEMDAVIACGGTVDSLQLVTWADALRAAAPETREQAPIPMVLRCPRCTLKHVDAPEPENGWTNPPHKSHLCHGCGLVWRPADVPTMGVASIATKGEHDTFDEALARAVEEPAPAPADGTERIACAVRDCVHPVAAASCDRCGARICADHITRRGEGFTFCPACVF